MAKAIGWANRLEFFNYAGADDQATPEALPTLAESHPGDGELGSFIGARNVAPNLYGNSIGAVPLPCANALMLAIRRRQGKRQA
jgi:hypothetical protein